MSGPAVGTAGPGRRRSAWVGLVIGIIAVSGALVAVLHDRGGEDEVSPPPDEAVKISHEWPAEYSGQVWITVDADDASPRSVTISWGPWERTFVHESADPLTYWFTKAPPKPGDANVPATVRIEPGAGVTFGQGPPAVGALDRSTGWDDTSDDPDAPA
jgi:hypothetical protein